VLKIYCALSAECAPERVHSTEVPNAALASCVVLVRVQRDGSRPCVAGDWRWVRRLRSLTHRAPNGALRSMEPALMTLLATLVYFRTRTVPHTLHAYPRPGTPMSCQPTPVAPSVDVGSRRLLVDQLLDGPSRSMQPREKETTGNPTRCLFCILWIPHATSNATLCLLPASDDLE